MMRRIPIAFIIFASDDCDRRVIGVGFAPETAATRVAHVRRTRYDEQSLSRDVDHRSVPPRFFMSVRKNDHSHDKVRHTIRDLNRVLILRRRNIAARGGTKLFPADFQELMANVPGEKLTKLTLEPCVIERRVLLHFLLTVCKFAQRYNNVLHGTPPMALKIDPCSSTRSSAWQGVHYLPSSTKVNNGHDLS
jgi:hypothetical protein